MPQDSNDSLVMASVLWFHDSRLSSIWKIRADN